MMFIETYNSTDAVNNKPLVLNFIKSLNVQVYPCGRRRSNLVDIDQNVNTVNNGYYIPFDPEARLNTEANNRKHSSLNGFTQSYLKSWDNNLITLSLGGYLFNIKPELFVTPEDEDPYPDNSPANFGKVLVDNDPNASSIYANICIEETPLFSADVGDYYTGILRDQARNDLPSVSLDLLRSGEDIDVEDTQNYYFSGLSFSTAPLSGSTTAESIQVSRGEREQHIISLQILEKITVQDGEETKEQWQIYQPAYLPKVEHGDTEDSVKVKTLYADTIIQNGIPIPSLKVVQVSEDPDPKKYQLQFSFGASN